MPYVVHYFTVSTVGLESVRRRQLRTCALHQDVFAAESLGRPTRVQPRVRWNAFVKLDSDS